MPLMTRYNIRCKEIDDYVEKFKPVYQNRIEEQIKNSTEWSTASGLDKEDLLNEFRNNAIATLDVLPGRNVVALFEGEQLDITIDDDLIKKYGYDIFKFYLSKKSIKKDVYTIPADHYDRETFEKLVELGLSVRGDTISLSAILESLKLKEMTAMVSDLNPPKFSKKTKATGIEYLLKVPNIKERIQKKVSFRSLFQIQPLPQEFSHIDLNKVSIAWQYAMELSSLICSTYTLSKFSTRDRNQREESDSFLITGYEISDGDTCCPYCKRMSKKYSKKEYPTVPLHIGCKCSVRPIFRKNK